MSSSSRRVVAMVDIQPYRGGNSEVKAVHGKACGIGEQTWASPVDHACEVSPDGSVMRCLSRAALCLLKWEDAREGSRQCVRTGWIWSGGPGACRASRAGRGGVYGFMYILMTEHLLDNLYGVD